MANNNSFHRNPMYRFFWEHIQDIFTKDVYSFFVVSVDSSPSLTDAEKKVLKGAASVHASVCVFGFDGDAV